MGKPINYVLGALIIGFLVGQFYMLDGIYLASCILIFLAGIPFWLRIQHKSKYEARRFQEITSYMEQMIYAFSRKPKIVTAIEDVREFYPDSDLGDILDNILIQIRKVEGGANFYRKGNEKLEAVYECSRLRRMNQFFEKIEESGGDYIQAIELLRVDLTMYEERVYRMQKEKKNIRGRMIMAFAISLLICGTGNHLVPEEFSTAHSMIGQLSAVILVAINLVLLLISTNYLQTNWLIDKKEDEDERLKRYYHKVLTDKNHSNRIGYRIAYSKSRKSVQQTFPEWLLDLTLYLDSGNVQMALKMSRSSAPCVIGEALDQMTEELIYRPNSVEPYLQFLSCYDLIYIAQAMKTLYGISETGIGDAREQMQRQVKQNMVLLNQVEQDKSENQMAGMGLVTMLPMLTGSGKLMVDMILFILEFLKKLAY